MNGSHFARFNRRTKKSTGPVVGLFTTDYLIVVSHQSIGRCAIISAIHLNLTKLCKLILMTDINLEFVITRAESVILAIKLKICTKE